MPLPLSLALSLSLSLNPLLSSRLPSPSLSPFSRYHLISISGNRSLRKIQRADVIPPLRLAGEKKSNLRAGVRARGKNRIEGGEMSGGW